MSVPAGREFGTEMRMDDQEMVALARRIAEGNRNTDHHIAPRDAYVTLIALKRLGLTITPAAGS